MLYSKECEGKFKGSRSDDENKKEKGIVGSVQRVLILGSIKTRWESLPQVRLSGGWKARREKDKGQGARGFATEPWSARCLS